MGKFVDGCYGSLKGTSLIAKVLAGRCSMHYTRVAAGKGYIPEDETPKTVDVPPDYVMDAMISAVSNPVDGECQVSIQLNSSNVETGFYVTGLLLYAEDPDEGEVPFTYLCLENEPELIRPSSAIVGKLAHFDIIAAVGDVDKVTATIDPNAFATLEAVRNLLTEHGRDSNTHADIRQTILSLQNTVENGMLQVKEASILIPSTGWNEDGKEDYPYYRDVPEEQAAESLLPSLTILPDGMKEAVACGMAPYTQVLDGSVRIWAKKIPATPIPAHLTLTGVSSSGGTGGGIQVMPPATAESIGAVKPGAGLTISPDGTLSVDAATEEEVAEILGLSSKKKSTVKRK